MRHVGFYGRKRQTYNYHAPSSVVADDTLPERFERLLSCPAVQESVKYKAVVESMKAFYATRNGLTPDQTQYFKSIEDKFDQQKLDSAKSWIELYGSDLEKQRDFKIMVAYYKAIGQYYQDVVRAVEKDPNWIPSDVLFDKMCQNKYAVKVIANTLAKPLYDVGSFVLVRKPAATKLITKYRLNRGGNGINRIDPRVFLDKFLDTVFMVCQPDTATVKSHAVGSKLYSIIELGGDQVFVVEERELRKTPKKMVEV